MVGNQVRGHLIEFGRVLDDPAKAIGGGAGRGIAEGGGIALDVMSGAKQLFTAFVGKAALENSGVRGREPVGLDRHPLLEFAGQAGERLFCARHRVVEILFGNTPQHAAQRIWLRNHMMVGESLDIERDALVCWHGEFLGAKRRCGPCPAATAVEALPYRPPRGARARYRRCWGCAARRGRNTSLAFLTGGDLRPPSERAGSIPWAVSALGGNSLCPPSRA